jgi:hypothetical protein
MTFFPFSLPVSFLLISCTSPNLIAIPSLSYPDCPVSGLFTSFRCFGSRAVCFLFSAVF